MAVVEAMLGTIEQSTQEAVAQAREQAREAAALAREQAAEAREQAAEAREQAREQAREAAEQAREQAREQAQQIAEQVAQDAARAAERANGRMIEIRRPGQAPMEVYMPDPNQLIPRQAVELGYAFLATMIFIIVGLPISRAFARRMDRRTAAANPETTAQLRQLQQSVEAIAIEVERISEAQRFTAKLLGEGAAQPVEVRQGERMAAR